MSDTSTLVIPSDPERLAEVDAFAERIIRDLGFTRDQGDDIAIAISEAVNNAIIHGNRNDSSKKVTIRFTVLDNGLSIEVIDEGEGYDPEAVADPTTPERLMDVSGRGLLIIRHLMDDVTLFNPENGNGIRMVKYFRRDREV